MKAIAIATLLGALLIVLLCSCSKQDQESQQTLPAKTATNMVTDGLYYYRVIRPRTQIGPNLWEIELWERIGDPDHVYRMVWPAWTNSGGLPQPPTFAGMAK